jgi:nicotinamide phosphoribosyltransferase
MNVLPVLLKDGYKVGHPFQYAKDTEFIYSNWTPRATRIPGVEGVIFFGLQYFIEEYLVRQFNRNFFSLPRKYVVDTYKRRIGSYLGPISADHIEHLHDHGHLPLTIKAVPEGTMLPFRVPALTIKNTHKDFFWLTNMVETLMSNILWLPCTSATTAFGYRKRFEHWADVTGGDKAFVLWQGHDFSMRGLPGIEAAMMSGAAHLLSFTGTDTIPALDFLEEYYFANTDKELVGGSVPATEHSVMSMGGVEDELGTIRRLVVVVYPSGIVSIVCDTWDFWKVLTEYLPKLKADIMARNGKVVIRPDSGDPVKMICGDPESDIPHVKKGAIEVLWDLFGGTITSTGHKQLDTHIGLIYGDSITPDRQQEILSGLAAKGFASTNVVLGIGSYTYQYVTRDTYGFAMKATHGVSTSLGARDIWKKPATDDGTKNSATGLLRVDNVNGTLRVTERCTPAQEQGGVLRNVFINGRRAANADTLAEIRERVASYLTPAARPATDGEAKASAEKVIEKHRKSLERLGDS